MENKNNNKPYFIIIAIVAIVAIVALVVMVSGSKRVSTFGSNDATGDAPYSNNGMIASKQYPITQPPGTCQFDSDCSTYNADCDGDGTYEKTCNECCKTNGAGHKECTTCYTNCCPDTAQAGGSSY